VNPLVDPTTSCTLSGKAVAGQYRLLGVGDTFAADHRHEHVNTATECAWSAGPGKQHRAPCVVTRSRLIDGVVSHVGTGGPGIAARRSRAS
jgi:hypothetical protein